jgi:predicted transcriptional regulator
MSYHEELQAKLEAVRSLSPLEKAQAIDTDTLEEKLVRQLESEFELGQYDLDESDILRSIKILEITSKYGTAFSHHSALKIFYALAKTDFIHVKNLYKLSRLNTQDFKQIINAMAQQRLLIVNEDKEVELTIDGHSLAERIGFDVFI